MSVVGGKADIAQAYAMSAYDPKRTLAEVFLVASAPFGPNHKSDWRLKAVAEDDPDSFELRQEKFVRAHYPR